MSIPLDALPGLMLFARVAAHGSLSSAAKSLGLSRSAVSKQLAAFENQMGAKLIQRTTRKLALTELGSRILQEAQRVESSLQAVESISDDFRQEIKGTIKVSCSTSIGRVILLPLLIELRQRYPELRVELGLEDRFVDLLEEQIDVAIRIGHLADSSLIARRLGELSWQLCASPNYLAKHGYPSKPEDLVAQDCLFYKNNRQNMNLWSFEGDHGKTQVKVSGPVTINDACALVSVALDGLGILLIDKAMVIEHLNSGALVPLLPEYPPSAGYPVYAVYPAREYLPAKTVAFVNFLLEKFSPKLA